jgi:hypothetical protein
VEIDNSKHWQRQHWNAIKTSYGKAEHFSAYSHFFQSVYETKMIKIADLNIHIIKYLAAQLGLSPVFALASELGAGGKRTERLLDICRMFDAGRYLSSIGAKEYMKEDGARELFEKEGIKVEFLKFNYSSYPQLFGNFVPGLSFIDCLFNCGANSSQILFHEKSATLESLE